MRIVLIALLFILFSQASLALVIENVTIEPSDAWLGESVNISFDCLGNVTANMTRSNIFYQPLTVYKNDSNCFIEIYIDPSIYSMGNYNVSIKCSSPNETAYNTSSFNVSKFTGYIKDISNPVYIGDKVNVSYVAKKNNDPVDPYSFDVYLDGAPQTIETLYRQGDDWFLTFTSPDTPGIYEVGINVSYDRVSKFTTADLDVRNDVEFHILSVDKQWINSGDTLTIKLKALDKGNPILMNKNKLNISIGSAKAEITSVSGDTVTITAPSRSPGSYEMKAVFSYDGSLYNSTYQIYYIVPVSGRFVDLNGKAINTKIKFMQAGEEKLSLATDSSGSYSGSIPPDTYDLHLIFPESTVILEEAVVNEFDDPFKYYFLTAATEGIINYGLYVYESDLSYSAARIEISYKENDVNDESDLSVFRCSNWNAGKKKCNTQWEEMSSDIDTVRNKVTLTTDSFSAFALGKNDEISLGINVDRVFSLNEPIEIEGIAQDSPGNYLANVTITARIIGTTEVEETKTDDNGIFRLYFSTPSDPGNYTLLIRANKQPFYESEYSVILEVLREIGFKIEFPDTIKVEPGQEIKESLRISNTGQEEIRDMTIKISDMDEEYFFLNPFLELLRIDETEVIEITFSVPDDAVPGTVGATMEVSGNGISRKKVFGFTIVDTSDEEPQPPTGHLIDITMPEIDESIFYFILYAIIIFSVAFLVKKKRKNKRIDIKNILSDIKNHLKVKKTRKAERYNIGS